jgi:hypothetical protein
VLLYALTLEDAKKMAEGYFNMPEFLVAGHVNSLSRSRERA